MSNFFLVRFWKSLHPFFKALLILIFLFLLFYYSVVLQFFLLTLRSMNNVRIIPNSFVNFNFKSDHVIAVSI